MLGFLSEPSVIAHSGSGDSYLSRYEVSEASHQFSRLQRLSDSACAFHPISKVGATPFSCCS
jgi:hypothetical protein